MKVAESRIDVYKESLSGTPHTRMSSRLAQKDVPEMKVTSKSMCSSSLRPLQSCLC